MNYALKWLIIVAIAVAVWWLIPDIVWQYIFFLRIPLLMGILLLMLPFIAIWVLPNILKNLFVLRGIWQVAFTILATTVAGIAIAFVTDIILKQGPNRFFGNYLETLKMKVEDFPLDSLWLYLLAIIY